MSIEILERWDFEAYKAHGRGQAQEVESALREGFLRVRGCAAVRLLPFVAYQWKDGPWQQAYARLGKAAPRKP